MHATFTEIAGNGIYRTLVTNYQ